MSGRRALGSGRKSVKIEIMKGIEETDPEYIVIIEGQRADDWDEKMIIKIAQNFIPKMFKEV